MNLFAEDKEFKAAIGAFIIAFSELEHGLSILCTMTEFDLRNRDKYIAKYLGLSFDKKRDTLKKFINEYLPELSETWATINTEIGKINRERRFIAHGFIAYYLPNENISTFIKENGGIVEKKQSIDEIYNLASRLYEVNTGRNGIIGEFHTLFTKSRINMWNKMVNEDYKIKYEVNGEIISEWKGKEN